MFWDIFFNNVQNPYSYNRFRLLFIPNLGLSFQISLLFLGIRIVSGGGGGLFGKDRVINNKLVSHTKLKKVSIETIYYIFFEYSIIPKNRSVFKKMSGLMIWDIFQNVWFSFFKDKEQLPQKNSQKALHTLTKKHTDDMRIMLKLEVKIDVVERVIIKLEGE